MIENYFMHLFILICIYSIIATSQNITVGNLGLLSLGNIAFFGIGAYTSAIISINTNSFILSFILAGIFGAISAMIMTYLMKKLKGDYYALGTLAFMFVIYSIFLNWTSLTRGPLGIPGISKPQFFNFTINTLFEYSIFSLIIATITILFFTKLLKSNFGLILSSIRDNETASQILGYNTFQIKLKTMFFIGFTTAIAGALYAHYISFIDPSSFSLIELMLVFTIIIVGGIGSIKGSIIGTIIIILLPEPLRFLDLPSSIIGPIRQIIYSIILLAIIYLKPKGVLGKVEL